MFLQIWLFLVILYNDGSETLSLDFCVLEVLQKWLQTYGQFGLILMGHGHTLDTQQVNGHLRSLTLTAGFKLHDLPPSTPCYTHPTITPTPCYDNCGTHTTLCQSVYVWSQVICVMLEGVEEHVTDRSEVCDRITTSTIG